ncbi:MAG TPA: flagellar biosynthesis protein FlhA, partial [Ignavibacteriales bacterium]|nr:flagellar biosynthesis protein FlhA [Ignavibacteriales bacterium]
CFIGVAQRDLSFVESLQSYTILTIGDGLVSQIPALIIAPAAGMVVTRSSAGTSLDIQMKDQLFSNPRVLGTVAGAVMLFAIVPGMPTLPFMTLSVVLGGASYMIKKQKAKEKVTPETSQEIVAEPAEEKIEQYLQVDPIEIEIGYGLISLVDENQGGNLFQKIASTRKFIALEFGLIIPPVRVRDNLQLGPNEYIIKVKGNVAASFEIFPDRFLAMNPGGVSQPLSGIPTKDPAFGLEAYWVSMQEKDRAEMLGYTVVDSISVLSTHLQETLKRNFDKILSRQSVKALLENLKKEYPAVIEDINPDILPLGVIQKVLQSLLKEFIPIKDLVQILESLIDYSKVTKNADVLTEYVRHSIGSTIANLYKDGNGVIHAMALSGELEEYVVTSLQKQKDATQTLGLTPAMLKGLNQNLGANVQNMKSLGYVPIVLASATIRPYFYRLINSSFPDLVVLSYTELPSDVEMEIIGKVEVGNAN